MIAQTPSITNEAYHALQADRAAKGEPTDSEKGEWVLDHYRKRVKPLIDEEAFAEILLALDRLTAFNLDNFRDPYLMREGKILRGKLTPKVLKLAERVGEYNERGEIVPRGTGEALRRVKEVEETTARKEDIAVAEPEVKNEEAQGPHVMGVTSPDDPAVTPTTNTALDPPSYSITDLTSNPTTSDPAIIEALTPEEISSLIASYQDLSDNLEELLLEDEEAEEVDKADALAEEARRKLRHGGGQIAEGDEVDVVASEGDHIDAGQAGQATDAKADDKGLILTGADGKKLA